VAVFAYGAIDEDQDVALASARSIAAWFPQTAPGICEMAGLPRPLIEQVRELYEGGEFQEAERAARLLPDAFVRQVALAGDAAQARERIEAVAASGADSIHVFPLGAGRLETIETFARCFEDVAAGARQYPAAQAGVHGWPVSGGNRLAQLPLEQSRCERATDIAPVPTWPPQRIGQALPLDPPAGAEPPRQLLARH